MCEDKGFYVRDKGNWWAETHKNGGRSAICKYLPRDFPGQITPDLPRFHNGTKNPHHLHLKSQVSNQYVLDVMDQ
jgi:hypothetical protein